jgi:Nucleoside diphosphate kinase
MEASQLAKNIYALRNSDRPSEIILPGASEPGNPPQPAGVLLLKPSSGHIPLSSLSEILDRLTGRYRYAVRAVAWWNGRDIKAHGLMALHYPGFHRAAHTGLPALSVEATTRLLGGYSLGAAFENAFGEAFELHFVRTPYDLAKCGISFERLNQWWELGCSNESAPIRCVQRLDEDTFALAMRFGEEADVPQALWHKVVVLLNGFYGKLEKDFEAKGCIALLIQRQRDSVTSWEDLRTRFAGKTNPFQAPPDTVRGDAARGLLPVETVSILANVIHLSANEAEGQRELEKAWWEPARFKEVFGADSRGA